MISVALDATGGDNAPAANIEGALQAQKEFGKDFQVVLVGSEVTLKEELKKQGAAPDSFPIVHAPEGVAMDEQPTEVLKNKPNSGLVTCVMLQKKGMAQASVSAGNSGAMMAACLMILGRVGGITRPAIACVLPSANRKVVLLDCGANVDEKPIQLYHFAVCGSIYAKQVLREEKPSIALLNMGEEEKKGPELIQETYKILKNSNLNFIGNIEGRDLMKGVASVVVTPGYTGNVVLKLLEGFHEFHKATFGVIDTPKGRAFDSEWNYSNTGGAMLLGLNGTGIITHGRSDAQAIKMGLYTGYRLASAKVAEIIGLNLQGSHP